MFIKQILTAFFLKCLLTAFDNLELIKKGFHSEDKELQPEFHISITGLKAKESKQKEQENNVWLRNVLNDDKILTLFLFSLGLCEMVRTSNVLKTQKHYKMYFRYVLKEKRSANRRFVKWLN